MSGLTPNPQFIEVLPIGTVRTMMCGYLGSFLKWREGSGDTVEIFDIHVDSKERRTGVGRMMVRRLFASLMAANYHPDRLCFAITRNSNKIAQQFYDALGFRLIARLPNFYDREEEDAWMYGRSLRGPI